MPNHCAMKFFLSVLLLTGLAAAAQKASFREIRLRPLPRFENTSDSTIVYPIVVMKNPAVGKRINARIREEIIGELPTKASLRKDLAGMVRNGLTDLSYEATFNRSGILSITISQEEGNGPPVSRYFYLNFDLRTGKDLTVSDLIEDNKLDSFRTMVSSDKTDSIKRHLNREKDDLARKEIDSVTYHWVVDEVTANCMDSASIVNFSLTKDHIEIMDPCELPWAIRSQEPEYGLLYTYTRLRGWMKPAFKGRLY
jgi:hypothetical protein